MCSIPGRDGVFGRTQLQLVSADNPLGLDLTDAAARDDVWTQNQPTRTGEREIACSHLRGLGHYRMRGFYTIQTQADFDTWLADQAAQLAPANPDP